MFFFILYSGLVECVIESPAHQLRSVDTLKRSLRYQSLSSLSCVTEFFYFSLKNILFATKGWRLLAVSGNRASCRAAPFPSIMFGTGCQVLFCFFLTEIQVCWYIKIEIYFLIFLFVYGNIFELCKLCKSWARDSCSSWTVKRRVLSEDYTPALTLHEKPNSNLSGFAVLICFLFTKPVY